MLFSCKWNYTIFIQTFTVIFICWDLYSKIFYGVICISFRFRLSLVIFFMWLFWDVCYLKANWKFMQFVYVFYFYFLKPLSKAFWGEKVMTRNVDKYYRQRKEKNSWNKLKFLSCSKPIGKRLEWEIASGRRFQLVLCRSWSFE